MAENARIITDPGNQRKPQGVKITCPECGHVWHSRGKGKWFICPECERKKTGFERGKHFKETRGLSMTVTGNDYVHKPEPKPRNQDTTQDPPGGGGGTGQENLLRRILKKPLLKI